MGFIMDTRCFIATIFSVLKSDGVVEGGTGTISSKEAASTKE
jgi:O-antigen biosynthesis protein WbqP